MTSEYDRPIFMSAKKVLAQLYFASLLIAARVARFAQLRRARPRSATGSPHISGQNPIFQTSPEKTTSLMALCRADLPSNGQTPGQNQTCFKGPFRAFVFQAQYSRILANRARLRHLFSHPKNGRLFRDLPDQNPVIGARIGLIFLIFSTPRYQTSPTRDNGEKCLIFPGPSLDQFRLIV